MRKPPSLRNNNGVIQLRVRIEGVDFFINRLGKYNNPVSIAKAFKHSPLRFGRTIALGVWTTPSTSTNQFKTMPLTTSFVDALEQHYKATGQGRVRHALRLVLAYKKPLRTKHQVSEFIKWMNRRGIAPQTSVGIISTCKRVIPESQAFVGHRIKVPTRQVVNDILTKQEVGKILDYLKTKDEWYYPIFYTWLSTGLRNSELIGLTWDAVDLEAGEIRITKTLRRWMDSNTQREWSDTKNRKHRIVPLTDGAVEVLRQHQTKCSVWG